MIILNFILFLSWWHSLLNLILTTKPVITHKKDGLDGIKIKIYSILQLRKNKIKCQCNSARRKTPPPSLRTLLLLTKILANQTTASPHVGTEVHNSTTTTRLAIPCRQHARTGSFFFQFSLRGGQCKR